MAPQGVGAAHKPAAGAPEAGNIIADLDCGQVRVGSSDLVLPVLLGAGGNDFAEIVVVQVFDVLFVLVLVLDIDIVFDVILGHGFLGRCARGGWLDTAGLLEIRLRMLRFAIRAYRGVFSEIVEFGAA